MASTDVAPLALDLDVLKPDSAADPITRDEVERALYALTGWQEPQRLIEDALRVIDAYARGVRAGRVVPGRNGHTQVRVQPCTREHLDEHLCPVTVKTVEVAAPVREVAVVQDERPLDAVTFRDTRALDQARQDVETGDAVPSRSNSREPALSVEQLLTLDESQLRPAQRVARAVLLAGEQRCADCGVTKPLDAFYRDNAKLTRRMGKCAACSNKAATVRRGRKTPQ